MDDIGDEKQKISKLLSSNILLSSTWWTRTTFWVEFFWLVYDETTSFLECGLRTSTKTRWYKIQKVVHGMENPYPNIPHLQSDWQSMIPHPVFSWLRPILKNKSPDWHSFLREMLLSAKRGTTETRLFFLAPRVFLESSSIRNNKISTETKNFLLQNILVRNWCKNVKLILFLYKNKQ